jgi:hypothetical protein
MRTLYSFNGTVIAGRNSADGSRVYLHSNQLGSLALGAHAATRATSSREFDPWGVVRAGVIAALRAHSGDRVVEAGPQSETRIP